MSEATVYAFEWDPAKALLNAKKHGVSFEEAATVFLDALALTVYDAASSQGEERWFTLGFDGGGRLLAVAHTYQDIAPGRAQVRIVSARRATRREQRNYEEEPR
ncbi:MAG: BrnT family toxin [Hyphomicrobiaceae bacterium]